MHRNRHPNEAGRFAIFVEGQYKPRGILNWLKVGPAWPARRNAGEDGCLFGSGAKRSDGEVAEDSDADTHPERSAELVSYLSISILPLCGTNPAAGVDDLNACISRASPGACRFRATHASGDCSGRRSDATALATACGSASNLDRPGS
jgi:hypothetical protein